MVRVIADDREAANGVVQALSVYPDCQVEVRRLRLGDYQIDNRLLLERKTLRDLVVSIIDGRFLGQARRLVGGTLRPVILLEGTSRRVGHEPRSHPGGPDHRNAHVRDRAAAFA
jgi:ERCC4-type nuclease